MEKYIGVKYPVERTPYGFFCSGDNVSQIKGSMLSIILTKPGERVMRPRFGTPLYTLKNKPVETIAEEARQMIAAALQRWERRVQVTEIDTLLNPDGSLSINVTFIEPTNLQDMQQLTLQIQLLD